MKGKRTIGIGYITCPTNADYTSYIETCFKTKTVSIVTEDSEVYHKIKLPPNLFSQIKFPQPSKKEIIGSIVIFVRPQSSSIPTIISLLDLDDSGGDLLPGQWKMTSHTAGTTTSLIQGDSQDGSLDIVTYCEDKGAEITLRATSKTKDSIVKVESDGQVSVLADKVLNLNAGTRIQLGEEDSGEAAVLGKSLKSFLEELLELIQNLQITIPPGVLNPATGTVTFTALGTVFLSDKTQLNNKKSDLTKILSELVFLQ